MSATCKSIEVESHLQWAEVWDLVSLQLPWGGTILISLEGNEQVSVVFHLVFVSFVVVRRATRWRIPTVSHAGRGNIDLVWVEMGIGRVALSVPIMLMLWDWLVTATIMTVGISDEWSWSGRECSGRSERC
jgi:hypothetical protein